MSISYFAEVVDPWIEGKGEDIAGSIKTVKRIKLMLRNDKIIFLLIVNS